MEHIAISQSEAAEIYQNIKNERFPDIETLSYEQEIAMMSGFSQVMRQRLIMQFDINPVRASAMATVAAMIYRVDSQNPLAQHSFNYRSPTAGNSMVTATPFKVYELGYTSPLTLNFCISAKSDSNFTAREWLSNMMDLPQGLFDLTDEQESFGPYFAEFASEHEKAHCPVGEDEQRADYAASLHILSMATDPQDLRRRIDFLHLFASYRYFGQVNNHLLPEYDNCYETIVKAIDDFNEDPEKFGNTDNIYAAALSADLTVDPNSQTPNRLPTIINTSIPSI